MARIFGSAPRDSIRPATRHTTTGLADVALWLLLVVINAATFPATNDRFRVAPRRPGEIRIFPVADRLVVRSTNPA